MKNLSYLFFSILLGLSACKKSDTSTPTSASPLPILSFSYTGNNNPAPTLVTFKNNSLNATSYLWDFGDGYTSTLMNPTHVYTKGGVYKVTLTGYNTTGNGTTTSTTFENILITNAYTKLAIKGFTLKAIPASSSFTGYFRIVDLLGNEVFKSSNTTINPTLFPSSFTLTNPIMFNNLNSGFLFQVWKYGLLSDTHISDSPFVPSAFINSSGINTYPSLLSLDVYYVNSSAFIRNGIDVQAQWLP